MDANVAAILNRQIAGIGPQHPTQTVAAALTLVSGKQWVSLCCWCSENRHDAEVFRVRAAHGECDACSYAGRDCLVVAPAA